MCMECLRKIGRGNLSNINSHFQKNGGASLPRTNPVSCCFSEVGLSGGAMVGLKRLMIGWVDIVARPYFILWHARSPASHHLTYQHSQHYPQTASSLHHVRLSLVRFTVMWRLPGPFLSSVILLYICNNIDIRYVTIDA